MPLLPPGPGLPAGLLKPPFSWHPDGPLIAVWDADLKVTTAAKDGREATCTVDQWPLPAVSGYGAAPAWSLNDPNRTLQLMGEKGMALYLHDARSNGVVGWFNDPQTACDWWSIAALLYLIDVVLVDYGPLISLPSSPPPDLGPWLGAAENQLDLGLKVYSTPGASGGNVNSDLAAAFFGARIIYEDAFGNVIAEQPLKVEDASFYVRDAGGGEAACDAAMLCETNAAYRVDNLLDGLTIAQDITTNWPAPSELDVPSLQIAWDEFIGYACDRFGRAKGPGGARNRCLVDERAWVSQAKWVESLNVGDAISRLNSGSDRGDGGVLLWFTLELEDLLDSDGTGLWGRFAEREPIDRAAYPYLAYLPRLTRSIIGEGIVWEVQVDDLTDAACEADWTVTWRMDGCPTKWTYGPVGEVWLPAPDGGSWVDSFYNQDIVSPTSPLAPEEDRPFYQLIEDSTGVACALAPTAAGTYTIELNADAEGRLRFGWEIKDDFDPGTGSDGRFDVGDSKLTPQYVEMTIAPPAGCSSDYTAAQSAVANQHVLDYFDAISDYLVGL